jgi:hypothetical protein
MIKRWACWVGRSNLMGIGVLMLSVALWGHFLDGPAPQVLFGFGGVGLLHLCAIPLAESDGVSDA